MAAETSWASRRAMVITLGVREGCAVAPTVAQMKSLRPALEQYLETFADCMTTPSQRHLGTYVDGQLGPLERKTAEAIAVAAGEPPRTLQQFLGAYRWDEDAVAKKLRERVRDLHAGAGGIVIVDETGCPKSGDHTVGVQRQYCGRTGKVDNCVMTVGLAYVQGDFYCLLDTELFLPENTWGTNKELRLEAGIPDNVVYRSKWQIGCELVDRALLDGVKMAWLTADELYGRTAGFRNRIAASGLLYVVEIPSSLSGWTKRPEVTAERPSGKPLKHAHVLPGERSARQVAELWHRGGPSWEQYRVKDTTNGPQVWDVRETRFYAREDDVPGPEQRLIIAHNVITGEEKYFLSNALEAPLGTILYVAFTRWYVEKTFLESKSRVGLDHFEVRTYTSVKRHLILSAVSLLYLVEETLRLKEQAPGWTIHQVREAIELQLDRDMSGRERDRQLAKLLRKLEYHHKRNAVASESHDGTQRERLHDKGVDLRSAIRCHAPWENVALCN
jgi:SRSO17 transposase